jgi:hypothetical protein
MTSNLDPYCVMYTLLRAAHRLRCIFRERNCSPQTGEKTFASALTRSDAHLVQRLTSPSWHLLKLHGIQQQLGGKKGSSSTLLHKPHPPPPLHEAEKLSSWPAITARQRLRTPIIGNSTLPRCILVHLQAREGSRPRPAQVNML